MKKVFKNIELYENSKKLQKPVLSISPKLIYLYWGANTKNSGRIYFSKGKIDVKLNNNEDAISFTYEGEWEVEAKNKFEIKQVKNNYKILFKNYKDYILCEKYFEKKSEISKKSKRKSPKKSKRKSPKKSKRKSPKKSKRKSPKKSKRKSPKKSKRKSPKKSKNKRKTESNYYDNNLILENILVDKFNINQDLFNNKINNVKPSKYNDAIIDKFIVKYK